jgi:hypothetical protein
MDNTVELSETINNITKKYKHDIAAAQDKNAVEEAANYLIDAKNAILKIVTTYYPNEVPPTQWSDYKRTRSTIMNLFNNDELTRIKMNRLRELDLSPHMGSPDQVNSGHGGKHKSLYKRNRNKSRKRKSRKNRKKTNRRRG